MQKKGENKGAVQPLFADFLIIASFEIWVCPHVFNVHCFGFKKLCVTKLWFFNGPSWQWQTAALESVERSTIFSILRRYMRGPIVFSSLALTCSSYFICSVYLLILINRTFWRILQTDDYTFERKAHNWWLAPCGKSGMGDKLKVCDDRYRESFACLFFAALRDDQQR